MNLDGMRRWYVNGQGQTFVILGAGEFQMGSPETEPSRGSNEELHRCQIGRGIALATTEVTHAQWRAFSDATNVWPAEQDRLKAYITTDDSPMIAMTWYEAAHYCNWLSEQEGIPEDQWCYETNDAGEYGPGMKAKEAFWELSGYRLPTEGEWEYACRAKVVKSRYYGVTDSLLPRYARYQANGEGQTHPVGRLMPNDYGLFDMQGNVIEWCYDAYGSYAASSGEALADEPETGVIADAERRLLRGGSFDDPTSNVRSANRLYYRPTGRYNSNGFRPFRTYHLSP
ncbi:MAG: formylglycine-generating enzyme family protein [Planctomycetaceae bacterium]|nr:formylglycine-generating enzyme family protein [Planctomycetaceae bacterium]